MFGIRQNRSKMKKKLMGLTTEIEMYDDPMRYEVVVDAATQLRTLLKEEELSLTMGEKLRVLKSVTKAKVRAFMGGTSDNYRTFKTLDAISGDLVQLL
jgi:hypothetical protein